MAKSPFFNTSTPAERQLYRDIITESIYIMGENILYLPRTIVNFDELFGEDILSKYTESFILEAYHDEQKEGFGRGSNNFTAFGIEVKDQATYTVSKTAFEQIVLNNNLEAITRPLEGDLVYSIISSELFQIKFVENEEPYRMFGDVQTYKLHCEAYKYSNQKITADIVQTESNVISTSITVLLLSGVGDFVVNSMVTNGTTTAKILDWNLPKKELKLSELNGKLNKASPIVSGTTSWTISKYKTVNDSNAQFDINEFLETKSDTIIDQHEVNALGKIVTANFMENF